MIKLTAFCNTVIAWCVFAIVFATPFSKSIAEICMATAIMAWAVRKIGLRDFTLPRTALNLPFLLFIILMVPSFFHTGYAALSYKAFFTKWLKFIALYFVIVDSMDKERLKDLFMIALLSIIVIVADGFIQYYLTGVDLLHDYPAFKLRWDTVPIFRGFPTASFPFPNDLSAWILLAIFPLGCACLFDLKGSKVRYLAAGMTAALFFLFFLAKARSAWIAFALSTLYIAVSSKKLWLILILVLMIVAPFVIQGDMPRYVFGTSSTTHRFSMWATSWEIFKQHPVCGNGINTYFENFRQMRNDEDKGKRGSYAHNCYLQMACDVGLIGLAAFLWVIAAYFVSMARTVRKVADPLFRSVAWGISIGVFAFLVHSFFDTNLYSLNLATLFWTSVAVSQSIIRVGYEKA